MGATATGASMFGKASSGWMNLGIQGAKGIFGLIQGIRGAREEKRLWGNRPTLGVTQGEKAADMGYNRLANATELPGTRQAVDRLGQTYAEGVSDAQKTSVSSLGATQSAVDLAGKKMDAIQNLAYTFADYKSKQMQNLASWNERKVGLENERFQFNEADPWALKYGQAVGQKQEGFASFGRSVDKGLGYLSDLQGTNQYMDILKQMYPNLGGGTNGGGFSPVPEGTITNFIG